jgi:valyl-tRNA synthetase
MNVKEFDSKAVSGILMPMPLEDRWILSRLHRVTQQMNSALAEYRFDEAAHAIYSFFWGEFCDWYLELVKPRLAGGDSEQEKLQKHFAIFSLISIFEPALRLLSPFMPFITEELWHALLAGNAPQKSIALAQYPQANPEFIRDDVEVEMAILQDLIASVRNLRAELKVEPKLRIPIQIHTSDSLLGLIERNRGAVERLAGVEQIEFVEQSLAKESGARSTTRFDVRALYEQKIDLAAERERLMKEKAQFEREFANAERQLANEQFLAKAPDKVVEGLRKRRQELAQLMEKNRSALEALG